MKITGGILRKRTIKYSDQKNVRPTSSKIREAVFSMIGQDLTGLSFLDAFGGSGIMGLEAYSRGAEPVWISEKNGKTVKNISETLTSFATLPEQVKVVRMDAKQSIKKNDWDIIFLDPPYAFDVEPYIVLASKSAQRMIIVETRASTVFGFDDPSWEQRVQKIYGGSKITIFRRRS